MNFQKQPFDFQQFQQNNLFKKLQQLNNGDRDQSPLIYQSDSSHSSRSSALTFDNVSQQSREEISNLKRLQSYNHNQVNNFSSNQVLSSRPRLLKRLGNGSHVAKQQNCNPFQLKQGMQARISVPDEGNQNFSSCGSNNYQMNDCYQIEYKGSSSNSNTDCFQQMNRNFSSATTTITAQSVGTADDQFECVFSVNNSPQQCHLSKKINKRLFEDKENLPPLYQTNSIPKVHIYIDQDQDSCNMQMNSQQEDQEMDEEEDIDDEDFQEFEYNERRPLDQLLHQIGKNEFKYDPENGGGRRRRIKKISRIDMIQMQEKHERKQSIQRPKIQKQKKTKDEQPMIQSVSHRPLGVSENLYSIDSDARILPTLDDCRNPELNSIDPNALGNLFYLCNDSKPISKLIIDCRFDYEFAGGHILGAININTPEQMEEFFFQNKANIENLMNSKTVIIFHCEFSQHRGPKMYRALREIDRRLHIDFYPQLFYNEIYLLEGGFKDFYSKYPQLCEGTYVPMADKNHKKDCKEQFTKCRKVYKQYSTREVSDRLNTIS